MKIQYPIIIVAIAVLGVIAFFILSGYGSPPATERLIIATTTSTVDTGLLDYLKPYFDNKYYANMTWLYLGTGQAITAASRGDADILLVHDRVRENAFINSGNGTHRVTIMYNDYVLVGPAEDPAEVKETTNVTEAFRRIFQSAESGNVSFVSRGDGSGTNATEWRLWLAEKVNPSGKSWYLSAGQGMGPVIRISNEKQAYTLSDRGTWLKLKSEMGATLNLQILLEGDNALLNPYGLIMLNSTKYPYIKSKLAEQFFLFIISDEGQRLIGLFNVSNQQLFFPAFGKPETIGLPSEEDEVQYWSQKLKDNQMKPPSWVSQVIAITVLANRRY